MLPLHITLAVPRPFWLTWTFDPIPAHAIAVIAIGYAAELRMAGSRGRRLPAGQRIIAFYTGLGVLFALLAREGWRAGETVRMA